MHVGRLADCQYARRHVVAPAVQCLPLGRFRDAGSPTVRAIVFADTGGREVLRLEQRPDPVPGSEAAEAFDYMAGSGKFGKVLLAF